MIRPRQPLDVYPGTHRPLGTPHPAPSPTEATWDADPIYKKVDGHWRIFYGIAHLSAALDRSPKTIYKWEEKGYFPRATFLYNADSRNGRRRLYTRVQIEGAVVIAHEEGLFSGDGRYLSQTRFPDRCAELFKMTRTLLPEPMQEKD